jgi:hypothetical protein
MTWPRPSVSVLLCVLCLEAGGALRAALLRHAEAQTLGSSAVTAWAACLLEAGNKRVRGGSQAWRLYRRAECSAAARALARAMICLFFANEVLDAYQRWQHLQTPAMRLRYELAPHRARPNRDRPPAAPRPPTSTLCWWPCEPRACHGSASPATSRGQKEVQALPW